LNHSKKLHTQPTQPGQRLKGRRSVQPIGLPAAGGGHRVSRHLCCGHHLRTGEGGQKFGTHQQNEGLTWFDYRKRRVLP